MRREKERGGDAAVGVEFGIDFDGDRDRRQERRNGAGGKQDGLNEGQLVGVPAAGDFPQIPDDEAAGVDIGRGDIQSSDAATRASDSTDVSFSTLSEAQRRVSLCAMYLAW